jgi:hypothetical protein
MAISCTKDFSIHIGGGYWTITEIVGFKGAGTQLDCTSTKNLTSNTQSDLNCTMDTGANGKSGAVPCWDCNFDGGFLRFESPVFGPFAVDTLITVTGALTLQCAAGMIQTADPGCVFVADTTSSSFELLITDGIGQIFMQVETCTPAEGSKIVAINGSFTQHPVDPPLFLRINLSSHGAGMFNQVNCGVTFTP